MDGNTDEPAARRPPRVSNRFDAQLVDLTDRGRAEAAALERSRRRQLQSQVGEGTSLAAVLVGLGERGDPVVVMAASGARHTGWVVGVGADYVELSTSSGGRRLVVFEAVVSVRTGPGSPPVADDRPLRSDRRFADVLADFAAEREAVLLVTRHGGERVRGRVRWVGHDVLAVSTETEGGELYLPLAAIAEASPAG